MGEEKDKVKLLRKIVKSIEAEIVKLYKDSEASDNKTELKVILQNIESLEEEKRLYIEEIHVLS